MAEANKKVAIPHAVLWSEDQNTFLSDHGRWAEGSPFYNIWHSRRHDFPVKDGGLGDHTPKVSGDGLTFSEILAIQNREHDAEIVALKNACNAALEFIATMADKDEYPEDWDITKQLRTALKLPESES